MYVHDYMHNYVKNANIDKHEDTPNCLQSIWTFIVSDIIYNKV